MHFILFYFVLFCFYFSKWIVIAIGLLTLFIIIIINENIY